jgi:hypothetical protein
MCRVDESIDLLAREMIRETIRATEASDPHRNGLRGARGRAARERQRHRKVRPRGQAFAEPSCLRGAAENEDSHVAR